MPLGALLHTAQTVTTLNLKAPCYRMIAKLAVLLEPMLATAKPNLVPDSSPSSITLRGTSAGLK